MVGADAPICAEPTDQDDLDARIAEFGPDSGFTREQLIAGLTTPPLPIGEAP